MLYICIYNKETREIQYPEEYSTETEEEKRWAITNANRLTLECMARGEKAGWMPYTSEEKQLAFE